MAHVTTSINSKPFEHRGLDSKEYKLQLYLELIQELEMLIIYNDRKEVCSSLFQGRRRHLLGETQGSVWKQPMCPTGLAFGLCLSVFTQLSTQ